MTLSSHHLGLVIFFEMLYYASDTVFVSEALHYAYDTVWDLEKF